jgi:hypothetical protein
MSVLPRSKSRAKHSQRRRKGNETEKSKILVIEYSTVLTYRQNKEGNDFDDDECRLHAEGAAQPNGAQHGRHHDQDATQAQQHLYRSRAAFRRAKRN